MNQQYDAVIIGAGIVGLATAIQIAAQKPNVRLLIVEKESAVASHQTGHNSGVLHSGLYYKPGSLKAKNCVDGYAMMVDFCRRHGIKHDICGKIVVATTPSEVSQLDLLFERGTANGLKGIRRLSAGELREREPHVTGIEGLFVPQTGIVDYTDVAEKMKEILLSGGVGIHCGEKVVGIDTASSASIVRTTRGEYRTNIVLGCAGLHSDHVARWTKPDLPLRIIPFRGEYYKLKKEKEYLVRHLIYPVPDPAFPFLGVHFTRMISGGVEAGPNAVFALKREGYAKTSFNAADVWESLSWPGFRKVARKYWRTGLGEYYRSFSKRAFTAALQKLIPEIQEEDLIAGGSGVRAQACDREGGLVDDFFILQQGSVVHVCNAPSPAATSSLSIGSAVARTVLDSMK